MLAETTLLPVIRITNPFNAREQVRETLEWAPHKTMRDYFPTGTAEHVVSVNGKIIEEAEWELTYLGPEDNLVLCPVPQGSGGGKTILRLIAIIAVAYFAGPAAFSMYGAAGGTMTAGAFAASGIGAAMTAGVMMAGSMLVYALLPPAQPSNGSSSDKTSSSYGIDGAKNTGIENIPVPVCYGSFRMAGNVVDMYTENVDGNTQNLYMLINAGEGPVAALSDIQLNDESLSSFKNAWADVRGGYGTQELMGWFGNTVAPYSQNLKLVHDQYRNYTTNGVVDKLRFDILFPSGLFRLDNKGNHQTAGVDITIEYRKVGTTPWIGAGGTQVVAGYNEAFYYTLSEGSGTPGKTGGTTDKYGNYAPNYTAPTFSQEAGIRPGYWRGGNNNATIYNTHGSVAGYVSMEPYYASGLHVEDNRSAAVRLSVMTPLLDQGKYETRIKRNSAESTDSMIIDSVYISDINEIIVEPVSFIHTALVGIKVLLTDQLNGLPNVTFQNSGRIIKYYDSAAGGWNWGPIANPAWIVWDILTNTRFGGGVPEQRLDIEAFIRWGDYCSQQNLQFNGVIDTEMTVWDACQLVCRCGHAQIVNIGTRFTVAVECEATPVMMFSVANMVSGSFKETWLGVTDRANEIDITYYDQADRYREKTLRVADASASAIGRKQRKSAITLTGVVDAERAYREGLFQLNMNRYILQTVDFSAPLEAIACTVGDLILVQHDMPQWGYAGRFEAGSTTSVAKLDREVPMITGRNYKLLALYDAIVRAVGNVISVAGTSVILSGFNGYANVRRMKINGRDIRVAGVFFAGGSNYGVVLDDTTGIGPGQYYELWETDCMLESDVVNTGTTGTTLTLQQPFPYAPPQFVNWMFGEVGKVKKPFRVKAITGSGDYQRDITAVEYNASVYDLSGNVAPTMNYSSLDMMTKHVIIESVTEQLYRASNRIFTRVTVNFRGDQDTYKDARVYASVNGAAWQLIDAHAIDRASIDGEDGATVNFKVVATDVVGIAAPNSTAPTLAHFVLGKQAPPADVTGAGYFLESFGIRMKWNANTTDVDFDHFQIRQGSSWDAGTVVGNPTMPEYFTKPLARGVTSFWIKAVDESGNYSVNATRLDVTVQVASVTNLRSAIAGQNAVLSWGFLGGSFAVDFYEVRYGTSWAAGTVIDRPYTQGFTQKVNYGGTRSYYVAAVDVAGNYGDPAQVDVVIQSPSNASITVEVIDNNVLLRWSDSKTTLPIDKYEIKKGSSYAAGSSIGDNGNGRFAAFFEQVAGTYTYWVQAFDTAGNVSAPTSAAASVSQPPDYVLRLNYNTDFAGLVYNFDTTGDLQGWTPAGDTLAVAGFQMTVDSTGTDPQIIRRYADNDQYSQLINGCEYPIIQVQVRRLSGSGWDGKVMYDTDSHGFSTTAYYAQAAGTTAGTNPIAIGEVKLFTFDMKNLTAGGDDWQKSVIKDLRLDLGTAADDDFQIDFVRLVPFSLTNMAIDNGMLYGPVPTTTFAGHFTSNGWTSPQDQINAGFPYFFEKSSNSAIFEEVIDYGALVAGINVGATITLTTVLGSVTVTPTLSYKKLWTDAWTDVTGSASVVPTGYFRWIKIRYDLTAAGGDDLVEITNVNIKMSAKQKNDAGAVITTKGGAHQHDNLLDYRWWVDGVSPSAKSWFLNQSQAGENQIGLATAASGLSQALWKCFPQGSNVTLGMDGGFNTNSIVPIVNEGYLFACLVYRSTANGRTYFGPVQTGANPMINPNGGATSTNPYFYSAATWPASGAWYLMVGYVHPNSYAGAATTISGVYDMTGARVVAASDWRLGAAATGLGLRCYHYDNATDLGVAAQYMDRPMIIKANTTAAPQLIQKLIKDAKDYGAEVFFNSSFVDVSSISVSGSGSDARVAVYDFVDVPNPTTFNGYIFDSAGNRVAGEISWSAKGV